MNDRTGPSSAPLRSSQFDLTRESDLNERSVDWRNWITASCMQLRFFRTQSPDAAAAAAAERRPSDGGIGAESRGFC